MPLFKLLSPVTQAWHKWSRVPALGITMHSRVWDAMPNPARPEPVVLVHGLGVSSRYWVRLGRRLAESFRVLAPDLPGFGLSPPPVDALWPGGPSVREQADQLLAWLDAHHINRAVLCGHSTGCQVVIDLAVRYPDRAERIILADPTFAPGRRRIARYLLQLLPASWVEAPSLTPLVIYEYLSNGLFRVARQAVREIDDPVETKLPQMLAPTLVLRGSHDLMVPRDWAEMVAARVPNAILVEIAGVGHAVQYSAPAVTAKVIGDFLLGRLDVDHPPPPGAEVAPIDNPRRDPLGPPQPVSPAVHAAADYALAAAALIVPSLLGWGPRSRRLLAAATVVSTAMNLMSDHPLAARRKLPMLAHANADVQSGVALLIAAATFLRHEPRAARRAVAALGAFQIASAVLTAKPTGPARIKRATSAGH